MNYGFVKVAAAIPSLRVADVEYNMTQITNLITEAEQQGVEVVCFPELCITSYTCQDLFLSQLLLDKAEIALMQLADFTRTLNVAVIVGLPVSFRGVLLNCGVVVHQGKIVGVVPKTYLPNYGEFYEMRWFASGGNIVGETIHLAGQNVKIGTRLLFETSTYRFGIEICEDVWAPVPPACGLALAGADLVFNLSASNESIGKHTYLKSLLAQQSARCLCGYVYAGSGFGESTQDLVFSGNALIYENGRLLAEGKRFDISPQLVTSEIDVELLRGERRRNTTFSTSVVGGLAQTSMTTYATLPVSQTIFHDTEMKLSRAIDAHPFVPRGAELDSRCEEIFNIQVEGLAKRLQHINCDTLVVGISGGLDSTLALLVCVRACDKLERSRKSIVGITMPGFGTTSRTYTNATNLMKVLGVTIREISIADACNQHFIDLGHDPEVHDVTYENSQARERTQILMDAANQMNGIVVGTGDLSELALGWATYNGDHMSMYGVNVSVPKTLVKHLVVWTANNLAEPACKQILLDIADTPISPELLPADSDDNITQKTEDLVGPYELHDFFLYYILRYGFSPKKILYLANEAFGADYDRGTVRKWLRVFLRRFFQQQFKRSCLPDGPKVGSCSLSPRGDWRMASDADASAWLAELDDE
ncbi:MAG: NAD(+) synthase [Prevotellaceae bacterium]|nr:NAD(+) synthase [Prevotellaceae bacterium]